MTKVHPCALYVGACLDIRRPWNTLVEVSFFVFIDGDRDANFFDQLMRETEVEELRLLIDGKFYQYEHIESRGFAFLYSINPLIFVHPINNRRIHYYHSILLPYPNSLLNQNNYVAVTGLPDYPFEIIADDVQKCGTIILGGCDPHEHILLMMKKRQIDVVTFAGTVYRLRDDDIHGGNNGTNEISVIRNITNNPEKVRRLIYFPVLSCFGEHDEENAQTYEPDDRYEFLTMGELCDFMDENVAEEDIYE